MLRSDIRQGLDRRERQARIDESKCEICGRKKYICGVSDCVRHFHSVEVEA